MNPLLHHRPDFAVGRAQRAAQGHPVADDVLRRAALDHTECQHRAGKRRKIAGNDRLQRADHLRGADDGVRTALGIGAVARASMNRHQDGIGRCVERARSRFNRAQRQIRHHMQAVYAVDMRIFHRACLDHRLRAAVGFLRRLEQELHRAAQLIAHAHEYLRRAQQDRRVRVVSAGMHHARMLRAEGTALRLLDGQRVHIRAQGDHLAGQRALDQADHPCALRLIGHADLIQRIHDDLLCLVFCKPALRNPVQRAPLFNDPILLRLHKRAELRILHVSASCQSIASATDTTLPFSI